MVARRRLGWLGPAIVGLGVVVAIAGVWIVVTGRPKAGDVIDTIEVDPVTSIVVRAEDGGDRNFVELHERSPANEDVLLWQALVPPYAGRRGAPGIAWSDKTVSVRVIRDGRAEVFALTRHDAAKLGGFKLAPGKGPVVKQTSEPVTLCDQVRSYELVAGVGWRQLVVIDLATGEGLWKQDLPGDPIEDAGLENAAVWVRQRGTRRAFRVIDGSEVSTGPQSSKSL
jgi:hypothetical protein